MREKRDIQKGLYLIIDPAMEKDVLLDKLKRALQPGICAVQIWDNFSENSEIENLVNAICSICHSSHVPVLINNKWEMLKSSDLDGVHFDEIPTQIDDIKNECGENAIIGITCGNDFEKIEWAVSNQVDYLSFCSIFPSKTQNSCEFVSFETIKKTLCEYQIPVFLAGGISPENISELNGFSYTGIAVVSGIMSAESPGVEIKKYLNQSNLFV